MYNGYYYFPEFMEGFTFGNPENEPKQQAEVQTIKPAIDGREYLQSIVKGEDLFDKLAENLDSSQITKLLRVSKRLFPIIFFLFAIVIGIGVGKMSCVSGCIKGIYADVTLFFDLIKIPLYSKPLICFEPCRITDLITIRLGVFIVTFIVVYFVWRYFDRKLEWRDRGNVEE